MCEGKENLQHTHGQTQDRKQPEMSKATREVLHRVRRMIPPMSPTFHKGMYIKLQTTSNGRWGFALVHEGYLGLNDVLNYSEWVNSC